MVNHKGSVIERGSRVQTPLGIGTVAYWRLDTESFTKPIAISVRLHSKIGDQGYSGTMFNADDVDPIP